MDLVPESHRYLLQDETKAFAFLATIMPDGTPQLTTVWFNTDGKDIQINTAKGRVKDRNMEERPDVALLIMDLNDPYRYLQVRGRVVEITQQGAVDHIHALSRKYTGGDFDIPAGHVRQIYRIEPQNVFAS